MNKKFSSFLLVLLLVIGTTTSVSAHTLGSAGSESSGWIHAGTDHWANNWSYYFDATTSSTWLTRFKDGEAKFEGESLNKFYLWEEAVGKTENFVENYSCSTCSWMGRYTYYSVSNDHPTRWRIQLNSGKTANDWKTVAAHEIGHIFGLEDLYNSSNSNKLMYGYDNGYRSLQAVERNGLDYIYNTY